MLSSVWNTAWLFFWGFALVAYLFTLFAVVGDLFRDRELGGLVKAIWFVFMFFLPFVTVLVYVVFRGRGMAERQQHTLKAAQAAMDNHIREVVHSSPADEIAKSKALFDAGAITQAEYDNLKAHALARVV
ncbi:SHOCT domain-containing protein [Neisseriaceae bacterium TC5R-5]|nr:SHOCT domain-containing protein [Neisseriaceae bacterium TC5R-5]